MAFLRRASSVCRSSSLKMFAMCIVLEMQKFCEPDGGVWLRSGTAQYVLASCESLISIQFLLCRC
jgi:hypothetical protein